MSRAGKVKDNKTRKWKKSVMITRKNTTKSNYSDLSELRDLSCERCLLECGLTTVETRRLRGDQIEVFSIVNGY